MFNDNIVFKIIVLGHQGVGKSSMLMKFMKNQFSEQYNVTIGVQFASKQINISDNLSVRLQIWDTAGQQTFQAIVRSFYKGISGVFFCFAIDKQQSFEALKSWIRQVRQNGHQEVMFFLIGTKIDLNENRKINQKLVDQLLKQIGAYFYIQTSAKDGTNIQTLFEKTAKIMHKKYISNPAFQQLVKPTIASFGQRRQSFSIYNINTVQQSTIQKKKRCC